MPLFHVSVLEHVCMCMCLYSVIELQPKQAHSCSNRHRKEQLLALVAYADVTQQYSSQEGT